MSSQETARVIGGHTAKISIGGKELGWFLDLSYSTDYGLTDVPVLGDTKVQEHQQTRYVVSGEFRRYMLRDDVALDQGPGLVPRSAADAIAQGSFDLDVFDKVSGKLIAKLVDVTLGSSSSAFSIGQLTNARITFRAIDTRLGVSQ